MRLDNTFEGQSDGTTLTSANSGGGSGDAFDAVTITGSGTATYDTDITPPQLAASALLEVGAETGISRLDWEFADPDEMWFRWYMRLSDATPSSHSTIAIVSESNASTTGMDIQLSTTGAIRMRAPSTLRYTSTKTLSDNEWVRAELHVLSHASNGHMEMRLFWGANLHGATPDETVGSFASNWDTGDGGIGRFGVGIGAYPGAATGMSMAAVAASDEGWIGPAVAPPDQLDTPTGFTFVAGEDVRELTADWDSVAEADHYELEVQVSVGDVWEAFALIDDATDSDLPITLDNTDGVDWETSYAARVRAMPEAE